MEAFSILHKVSVLLKSFEKTRKKKPKHFNDLSVIYLQFHLIPSSLLCKISIIGSFRFEKTFKIIITEDEVWKNLRSSHWETEGWIYFVYMISGNEAGDSYLLECHDIRCHHDIKRIWSFSLASAVLYLMPWYFLLIGVMLISMQSACFGM